MITQGPDVPWARLPAQLAASVAPEVGRIQAEIVALIDTQRGWTERVADAKVRADLLAVTDVVVSRFVALIGTASATFTEPQRAMFRDLGAGEAREGRGLEDLLAAYRIGTRVMYTEVAEALALLDPSPAAQVALGEAVFALVDALQAESAEGYAHEVSTHAGERERRLRRLADALFAADEDTVRAVAAQVGWTVPASVAVVLVPPEAMSEARSALGAGGFVVEREGAAVAVAAAEVVDAVVHDLAGPIEGRPRTAGLRVGPTVPLREARRSWVTAQLLPEGFDEPLWTVHWLPRLLTRGAPEVTATIIERGLTPLEDLREPQRERLTATLAAWLRHWGQRSAIAAELGIHPQTVAYRVNQLREVFGDGLDDPGWRLEMQLALLAGPGWGPR